MSNQHVVQRSEGWAVRKENAERDSFLLKTQQRAFQIARNIAINQGGEVFLHGRGGRIRQRNTYGKKDPFPPPG